MFLNKIKNTLCVLDTKFVSATNVACPDKRGNVCVGNNVSATMCPHLPGPLDTVHMYNVQVTAKQKSDSIKKDHTCLTKNRET